MKLHFLFLLVVALLNSTMHCSEKTTVPESYVPIKSAGVDKVAHIVQWVKNNKKALEDDGKFFDCDDLSNCDSYVIDINNDGKQEYVFIDYQGQLNCLLLRIFAEDDKGIRCIDMPYTPVSIGLWKTPFDELFVQAQGKIYICTTEFDDYQNKTRDIYFWEKDKISFACDTFWIAEQRKLFNKLYEQGLYNEAYTLLDTFEKKCRHSIDPQADLWLRSDISLAALKNGNARNALAIIKSIKGDTAFAHASKKLKKAVETNESLSQKALEKEISSTKGKYDYDWLLSYKERGDIIGFDPRFDTLLSVVVPDIMPASCYRHFDADEFVWKDEIKMHFRGQHYGGIEVIGDRYIVCAGHVPHHLPSKGFLWCDVKEKVSVVAMTGNPVCVTSRSLEWEELPAEFYNALKTWLLGLEKKTVKSPPVLFYDRHGTPFPLQL
jgi:hypothetical protein